MTRCRGLLGAALVALVVGCGGAGSSPVANAATAAETPTPQSNFGPGKCPRDASGISFPANFPVYPGAVLVDDRSCTGFASPIPADDVDVYRRWTTNDSGQKVVDFYGPSLQRAGWTVTKVYPEQSDGSAGVSFGPDYDSDSVDYTKVGSGGVIEVWIWISSSDAAVASPTPTAAPNLCGAPANPWNYNFCGGKLITSPPPTFCVYFDCISNFPNGVGYVVQCVDGTFSKSGGRSGVCSYHGGFRRNLYAP